MNNSILKRYRRVESTTLDVVGKHTVSQYTKHNWLTYYRLLTLPEYVTSNHKTDVNAVVSSYIDFIERFMISSYSLYVFSSLFRSSLVSCWSLRPVCTWPCRDYLSRWIDWYWLRSVYTLFVIKYGDSKYRPKIRYNNIVVYWLSVRSSRCVSKGVIRTPGGLSWWSRNLSY